MVARWRTVTALRWAVAGAGLMIPVIVCHIDLAAVGNFNLSPDAARDKKPACRDSKVAH